MKELYSKTEDFFSGAFSVLGTLSSVAVIVILSIISKVSDSGSVLVCSLFYGISMFLCYTISAVYHFFKQGTVKIFLRKLSVSGFFVFLTASVAPVCILSLKGVMGTVLLMVSSVICILSVILTFADIIRFRKVTVALYVLECIAPFVFSPDLIYALTADGFFLYALGSGVILLGVLLSLVRKPVFHTAWHVLALTGMLIQFFTLELNVFSLILF